MPIVTTLSFAGLTEEVLDFYHEALDAETVFLMRFRDSPDQSHTKTGMEDMIFHATFRIDGTDFMASDVEYSKNANPTPFTGFSLALSLGSVDRAKRIFAALCSGGQVVIPPHRISVHIFVWYRDRPIRYFLENQR